METNTHTPNKQFFDELIEKGYKSFSLADADGNGILPMNQSSVTPLNKTKEILNRFKTLPDGLYTLTCSHTFARNYKKDAYILKKGNQNLSELKPIQINVPEQKNKSEKMAENLLSIDEAFKNIKENATLKAENEVLRSRVKDLEVKLSELENEFDDKEMSENEEPNKVGHWLQTIMPTLSPLADEFFKMQNRRISLEEKKLNFRTPTQKPLRKSQQKKMQYPDINNEQELNSFFDYLEKLSDSDFEKVLVYISTDNPELYELICTEFYGDESEENEEEKTQE